MLEAKGHQVGTNDVAIVGMALRVPGARSVEVFWHNLKNGVESIRDLSREELIEAGEDPARLHNPNYVPRTADLPDMEMFDAEFFSLSPKEAAIMDPQHRQFLECAWEALEDAGKAPSESTDPIGVFAGCGMGSYFYFNVCSNRHLVDQVGMFLLRHTGNDKDFLATRASFLFDLKGPSVNIQTACSTSLVAVHYAAQSLLSGECDMALAGGVTIELPHRRGYVFNPGEILSPDGHCRPFDHRAAGTVFGSGTAVVVLRRLGDALRDGDRIHAVIKGTAINNDGGGKAGYLAPSVAGQAQVVVEAQAIAAVAAETIGYVECHGTGTRLGDPIEIAALSEAFRQSTQRKGFCYVGSVKSNIGHLDTAAGVVGLIKAALSLKHGEVPPTLGFERPNPEIDFDSSPFRVCDRLSAWPIDGSPRRAAVHSLGVGGTNAHVILEEPPLRYVEVGQRALAEGENPLLLLLSARNRQALNEASERLKDWLSANTETPIEDVAHTLLHGRKPFEEWMILPVRDRPHALAALADRRGVTYQARLDQTEGAVFMFPGGGAQYPGMARQLYTKEARFRHLVDEGLSYLPVTAAAEIRTVWLEADVQDAASRFLKPSLQLPAILITEIALARLWQQFGLQPNAMIGHSMGEYAAACLAGVMTFADAVKLVHLRGELFEKIEPSGMLSIPLDEQALLERLPEALDLACVNGPALCVVSGRNEALELFERDLVGEGIEANRLAINIAAHSRLLDPILTAFESFIRTLKLNAPTISIISNLTGQPLTAEEATDPQYWRQHLRRPVRFSQGLGALASNTGSVFIEVGPGRVLSSLAKSQGTISASRVIHSLPHAGEAVDDREHFYAAVGRAYAVGLRVNLDACAGGSGARLVSLPTYPFQHRRYFIDPAASQDIQPPAPRLEKVPELERWGYRPRWKRSLSTYEPGMEQEKCAWLIFVDSDGLGEGLAGRLRKAGHEVVTVMRGDNFRQRGDRTYVLCPEAGKAGYSALFQDLRSRGLLPNRLVHLWLADKSEHIRAGSSLLHQHQEWGLDSLVFIGQAWGDLATDSQLSMTIITREALKVGEEDVISPDKAMVLGPALVLPKEMAEVSVRVVDVGSAATGDRPAFWQGANRRKDKVTRSDDQKALAEQLWEELHGTGGDEVVALRGERRFTHGYEACALAPVEQDRPVIRQGGVYLFVGGLSEIALALAMELATKYQARLVLVARQQLPGEKDWCLFKPALADARTRSAMTSIKALEEAGAEVLYVRADITDSEQMAAALQTALGRFGEINGVFHCAGVLDDGLVQSTTHDQLLRVLSPKVTGLRVLDRVLKDVSLDFLALFSSTSTDVPRAGQVAYVAANAYLNAYAQAAQQSSGRRVLSLHWGIWKEVGLAARAVGTRKARAEEYPTSGDFFHRWVADERDGELWLEAILSPRADWLLGEHRLLSGTAVLPGTAYLEALAQAAGEYGLGDEVQVSELEFQRPFLVDDDGQKQLRLRFEPRDGEFRATIVSKEEGEDEDCYIVHARALVKTLDTASRRIDIEAIRAGIAGARSVAGDKPLATAQDDRLRFGPRWAVLRTTAFDSRQAIADLSLPELYRPDMASKKLHPALLDIATGFALGLAGSQAQGSELWVPASYGEVIVHKHLPASIVSWVRLIDSPDFGEGFAVFDVTICDGVGQVLVDIRHFVMRRLETGLAPSTAGGRVPQGRHDLENRKGPGYERLANQVDHGITPEEGFEAMVRSLALPRSEIIVSSIDLKTLRAFVEEPVAVAAPPMEGFDRPELDCDFVAPRNPVEEKLAHFWRELLGLQQIGVDDSFFDLGGHSLIAVRLFRMIKQEYGLDLPISTLFDCPTIALCAARIDEHVGPAVGSGQSVAADADMPREKFLHLVHMAPGPSPSGTPLFICAGMFGNVLNLRHLSVALAVDRPVYGLQARGLYGEHEPHESFDAMARDYLSEIRRVQPHGPYLLAGYSGGGLVALEMARQLREQNESVEQLAMFDTPLPRQPALSLMDKAWMKAQDIRRHRARFFASWLRDRRKTVQDRQTEERALRSPQETEGFSNIRIELAFRAAARAYQVRDYDGHVVLFRPAPTPFYHLSGGRRLQEGRNIILPDNGWGSFLSDMDVVEVPGDHDTMMLEPFVRVLAERLRHLLKKPKFAEAESVSEREAIPMRPLIEQTPQLEAAQ